MKYLLNSLIFAIGTALLCACSSYDLYVHTYGDVIMLNGVGDTINVWNKATIQIDLVANCGDPLAQKVQSVQSPFKYGGICYFVTKEGVAKAISGNFIVTSTDKCACHKMFNCYNDYESAFK